jgi:septum formation protein
MSERVASGAVLWRGPQPPLLASKSAARRMLLQQAGLAVDCETATIDERALEAQSALSGPGEVAALLARAKAVDVAKRHPQRVIIGADQTLALGARRFSKPAGRPEAAAQLAALAGATHELHSAVAVVHEGEVRFSHVAVARMTMRSLSAAQIETYLDAAGPVVTTSVGAYQLEGLGVHLFERVEGDHFTVLGLPLLPLLAFLRGAGWLAI